MAMRMALFCLGLMIIGSADGYAATAPKVTLTLYHVGVLGVVGLISRGGGAATKGKGRRLSALGILPENSHYGWINFKGEGPPLSG